GGKVYDQPVIQLDILPTALAAVGVNAPSDSAIDGVNLFSYLSGAREGSPHDALYWRLGPQMAIRQGDWKLVRYDPAVDGMKGRATEAKLYNLANDIGETNDLIEEELQRAAALQAAWDKWNESNVPPLWGDGSRRKRANRNRLQSAKVTAPATPSGGE
ncbi:MAG: sulfatase, partial [Planctomycetes bacterium]|nr:sulfatase [Planctomycetota bacterium]